MNDATLKEAMNYAQSGANTWKNDMQYLIDMQNQQNMLDQQTAAQRYQNLVNQINQQRDPIQQGYAANTQSAYINKMLAGRQINQNLSQMGLNTSGFGVGEQAKNEVAYGQNLNQLNIQNAQALQGLENQITNARGEYNVAQTGLDSQYNTRMADLMKYISEGQQNQYNTAYNRYMTEAERQRQIEYQKQQDLLAQQKIEYQKQQDATANKLRRDELNKSTENNLFYDKTPVPINTPTPTDKNATKVKATYSYNLSSKTANNWVDANISKKVIKNKGITIGELKSLLSKAYQSKVLTEEDVQKVLKTFGLQ